MFFYEIKEMNVRKHRFGTRITVASIPAPAVKFLCCILQLLEINYHKFCYDCAMDMVELNLYHLTSQAYFNIKNNQTK